jgi:hypothetical protein
MKRSPSPDYSNVPALPSEIWLMIAKQVKREPPPVGEAGNWNDNFSQQDLTRLMRVNSVSLVPRSIEHFSHDAWDTRALH